MTTIVDAPMMAVTDPRPAPLQRLDGAWTLIRDQEDGGAAAGWTASAPVGAREAPVPGIIQQVYPNQYGIFWYHHHFQLAVTPQADDRIQLRFGMVDYQVTVWVNGHRVGEHEGGETPFMLDITSAVRATGTNVLAMRVINPVDTAIDGIILKETPHRNKVIAYVPGASYNYGGILQPVTIAVVPAIAIASCWLVPDPSTGTVAGTITVANATARAVSASLILSATPAVEGTTVAQVSQEVVLPPGDSDHAVTLTIPTPIAWSPEQPFLYRLTSLVRSAGGAHDHSVRIGFRDFRVVDGYFQLNGRRLYLRSTHTGNHYPIGQVVPQDPDLLRRDLLMAKVSGYNTVRFISGMAYGEQLDFCDEIGLLVIEENLAGWCLADSPHMTRRFDVSLAGMIRRDRHHPSVVIWGLLNETQDNPTFRHAVASLPLARSLDRSRLVLLSSGRWDGHNAIGSVCNPGQDHWQTLWGMEAADAPPIPFQFIWEPAGGYAAGAGDAHLYPPMPIEARHEALLRGLGSTKPVFLSEYGVGSLFNAVEELKGFDRYAVADDLPDRAYIRSMADRFVADWTRWGMDAVYPFAEDFLRDSGSHMSRQRRNTFDIIRANGGLCGYNLTGMLDHALTGEGMWSFWRRWKPGAPEVLQDGWAPLRWSLFVRPRHAYAGRPVAVEAVLASDGVLRAGAHPARLKIFSRQQGTVWERAVTVVMPALAVNRMPLALSVIHEELPLDLPAGDYVFAANLESGGIAVADRLPFTVTAAPQPRATATAPIAQLGLSPTVVAWLAKRGYPTVPFTVGTSSGVVLVGDPGPQVSATTWQAVEACAAQGQRVVFLSAAPLLVTGAVARPLAGVVSAKVFHDWLYHQDTVMKPHPLFAGLPGGGLLDWDHYGPVTGHTLFSTTAAVEVIAASFAIGYPHSGGYESGLMLAWLRHGAGKILVSGLRILEHIDIHPAADRLLINIITDARPDPHP